MNLFFYIVCKVIALYKKYSIFPYKVQGNRLQYNIIVQGIET